MIHISSANIIKTPQKKSFNCDTETIIHLLLLQVSEDWTLIIKPFEKAAQ